MYSVASYIATAVSLPLLGFIAVCLRFYVRLRLRPTYIGIDDWMIAFSCLLVCASGANQVVGKIAFYRVCGLKRIVLMLNEYLIIGAILGELGRDNDPINPRRLHIQSKVRCLGCVKSIFII